MVSISQLLQRRGIAGREEYRRRMAVPTRPTPQQLMEQQEKLIEEQRKEFETERKTELEKQFEGISKETQIYQERISNIQAQLARGGLSSEKKGRLQDNLTSAEASIRGLSEAKTLIGRGYSPSSVRQYVESKISRLQEKQKFKQRAIQFEGEPLVAWREPSGKILYQSMPPEVAQREGLSPVIVGMVGGRFQELPRYRAEFPSVAPSLVTPFKFPETPSTLPTSTTWQRAKRMIFGTPIPQLEQQITPTGREIQKLGVGIITVPTQKLLEITKPVREYKIPYKLPPITGQIGGIMTQEDIERAYPKIRTVQEVGAIPTEAVELVGEKLRERAEMEIRGEPLFKPIVPQAVKLGTTLGAYVYAPYTMLTSDVLKGATRYSNLDKITERTLQDQYSLHTAEPVEEGYRHLTETEFKEDYETEIKEEIKQGILLETGIPLAMLTTLGAYKTYRVLTKPRGVSTKILGTSQKVSPTLEGKQKIQTDIMFETKTKTWFGTKTHVGVARSKTVTTDLGKAGETVTYGRFGQEGVVLPSGKIKIGKLKEFNVLSESAAKDATITAQLEQAGIIRSGDIKGFQELFAGKVAVAKLGRLDIAPIKTDFIGTGIGVPILKTPKTELTVLFGKTIGIKKAKVIGIPSIYEGGIFSGAGITDDLFFLGDSGVKLTQKQLMQIQIQRAQIQAQVAISAVVTPPITKAIPTVVPAVTTKPIIEMIRSETTIIKPIIKEAPISKIITPTIKPKPIKDILLVKPIPAKPTYEETFEYVKPTETIFAPPVEKPLELGIIEGRIPTGFLEPAKPRPSKVKLKVEPILFPIIKPGIKAEEKARVVQLMKAREELIERARVISIPSLIPRAKAEMIQRARVTLKVKQISPLKVRQVPVTRITPIIKPRVPRLRIPIWIPDLGLIPRRRLRIPRRKKPLELGYRVEVRRKGIFVPLLPFAVPKGEALFLGRRAVKRGAPATFKLIPTREKPRKLGVPRITERALAIEFRKPKKGEEPLTFIQKRKYRIVTPGEKREITMKGWEVRRGRKERWL